MKISTGYEKRKARLEIVPLMDVIFLLLIFFVYSMLSMTTQRGITVHLPSAASAETNKLEAVVVSISADNRLFVDKQEANLENLIAIVQAKRNSGGGPVIVNGDKQADFGLAISILDQLRRAGIPEVSFGCVGQTP